MIQIYGDWYADVYDRGYIVGKIGTTYDRRLGRDRDIIPHPNYFHDLSSCVDFVYQELLRAQHGKHRKHIDLEEAIKDMRFIEQQMKANTEPMRQLAEKYIHSIEEKVK